MTPRNFDQETVISAQTTENQTEKKTTVVSRARVSQKVKSGMFDAPEIIAVSIAGSALVAAILAYFFMLQPARTEFKTSEAERSQKQTKLLELQAKAQEAGTNAAGTVDLISSVDRFETNFLPVAANGNAALYKRLNDLIRVNGVRNTAGPEYSSLETVDAGRAAKMTDKQGRGNKQQGIFPGTYVTVTVEGNYANLRRFISDIESTRQFLIVNAIEIESNSGSETAAAAPQNETVDADPNDPDGFSGAQANPNKINPRAANNPAGAQQPAASNGAAGRGAVSLRLEMAAYFRRNVPEQLKIQN